MIGLAHTGQLDILPALYLRIIIPPAVASEVAGEPAFADLEMVSWLQVSEPVDADAVAALRRSAGLGPGETEAILLAERLGAGLIIDEQRGRRVARERGLLIAGVVGVLMEAKREGLITEIGPSLRALQGQGFRLSDALIRAALEQVGEPE